MADTSDIINNTLVLVASILKPAPEAQKRRDCNAILKNRKKLYKIYKKNDGVIDEEEQRNLEKIDNAYMNAILELAEN